jgi:hypothetical protein
MKQIDEWGDIKVGDRVMAASIRFSTRPRRFVASCT